MISFSLWGNHPMYLKGAIRNAELLKELQPNGCYGGYSIRMYVDDRLRGGRTADSLITKGVEIIWKDGREVEDPKQSYRGLFWRLHVAGDSSIDRFIVRDTDSRLNKRDAWAVRAWEASGCPFHCQRDHPACHRVPIMGGLFGAVRGFMEDFIPCMEAFLQHEIEGVRHAGRGEKGEKELWGADQTFLWRYVWPVVSDIMLCHDDYRLGLKRGNKRDRKYREGLPDNLFVGQQYDEFDKPIWPGGQK